jgi:hypothetical protein
MGEKPNNRRVVAKRTDLRAGEGSRTDSGSGLSHWSIEFEPDFALS